MTKHTFLALAFAASLACCKKDDNGGTTAPTPNFQPTKAGSTWTYQLKDGAATSNYTLTATTKDSTHNGKSYRVFTRSGGGSEYYHATGSDYYQFGIFDAIGQVLELLYLKGNLAVNGTWEETRNLMISSVPVTVKFTYKIAEKDISYTVAGKTYPKVTRVNIVLTATGVPIAAQDINYYYADGVGRIYSKVLLTVPLASIATNTETSLTAYTIVP